MVKCDRHYFVHIKFSSPFRQACNIAGEISVSWKLTTNKSPTSQLLGNSLDVQSLEAGRASLEISLPIPYP